MPVGGKLRASPSPRCCWRRRRDHRARLRRAPVRLAVLSVSWPAGPLAAYRELVTVDVYRIVLKNTVVLALVVSSPASSSALRSRSR